MKKVLMGNHSVSYGASLSKVDVIAAYPITPQTQIVEELSELCADGTLDAKFLKVESEHSAMASCIGAAQTGARAFTATSAQGLTLMHELLHWASGGRLPIVLANVNRSMAPGWSIWTDQNDSLSQRDTGWMQFYCESNQEILDTIIQAYKISEQVLIPSMVILDAFFLSHTYEPVDIPDQEKVDAFLPKKLYEYRLDTKDPHAFHCLTPPDVYFELRYKLQVAMDEAKKVIENVGEEFGKTFGRRYGLVEEYYTEDAELILVSSGSAVSTARVAIDQLREKGESVGLLKVRTFRPFPTEKIQEILSKAKKVAVMDRNISYGHGGMFAQEIKAALYHLDEKSKPKVYGYIVGLGGRDITPEVIINIIRRTQKEDKATDIILWEGLK